MQNLKQRHQQGMVTLVIALMLMLIISIVILLVARSTTIEQRISANEFAAKQTFAAAQAGLQFAIPYLAANKSTIVRDTDNDGYIDSYSDANTNNVSLSNGASYTITYSNPQHDNLDLIQIQSVGTSANGATTRTVTQLVQSYNSGMAHPGNVGLVGKSIVNLSGNVDVINTVTNSTIHSGGLINSSGSVSLTTSLGSTGSVYDPEAGATMNNTALQDATATELFQNFFGALPATVRAGADLDYTSSGNYSATLNGVTGKVIWIEGDASFSSNAVIGSQSQPVIIIVNGTVDMSGTVVIHGFVYAMQSMNFSGSSSFRGVAASGANFNVTGSVDVIYDSTVINNLNQLWQSYAPVAGSWRDF